MSNFARTAQPGFPQSLFRIATGSLPPLARVGRGEVQRGEGERRRCQGRPTSPEIESGQIDDFPPLPVSSPTRFPGESSREKDLICPLKSLLSRRLIWRHRQQWTNEGGKRRRYCSSHGNKFCSVCCSTLLFKSSCHSNGVEVTLNIHLTYNTAVMSVPGKWQILCCDHHLEFVILTELAEM